MRYTKLFILMLLFCQFGCNTKTQNSVKAPEVAIQKMSLTKNCVDNVKLSMTLQDVLVELTKNKVVFLKEISAVNQETKIIIKNVILNDIPNLELNYRFNRKNKIESFDVVSTLSDWQTTVNAASKLKDIANQFYGSPSEVNSIYKEYYRERTTGIQKYADWNVPEHLHMAVFSEVGTPEDSYKFAFFITPVPDALQVKAPIEAKPEVKRAIDTINKVLGTVTYKAKSMKASETSHYKVDYVGECELVVKQAYSNTNGEKSETTTNVNLKSIESIESDSWKTRITALKTHPYTSFGENKREGDTHEMTFLTSDNKARSTAVFNSIEAIIAADKCQPVSNAKILNPEFTVKTEIVGDASVKFKVTTNIPGKVKLMMRFRLEKSPRNSEKNTAWKELVLANGVGEVVVDGVYSGSKATEYKGIVPGKYVGELDFNPEIGLLDYAAQSTKIRKKVKKAIPIDGVLKGQEYRLVPA